MSRNNAEFLAYIQSVYFKGSLTTQQLTAIGMAYPDDITQVVFSVSLYSGSILIFMFFRDLLSTLEPRML